MLRHSLGLLAGLVLTPLLWAGAAWSASGIAEHAQAQRSGDPLLTASAAMIGIGLVCGVLAGTRIAPVAAFVAGATLLGVPLWALLGHASMSEALPGWLTDPASLPYPLGPGLPLFLALGTLLFISALAPSRWRSPRHGDGAAPYPPAAPGPAVGEERPAPPPEAERPSAVGWADDSAERTTTPFRRDTDGVRPLDREDADRTRVFGDGR